MTTGTARKGPMLLGLNVLVALFGLCTIFAFVVTIAVAWQEHAHARWPVVTAQIETCGMDQTSTGRRERYYIHCRVSYALGTEQIVASVYSMNVPSPEVWQYPPNQIGPFEDWVDEHPPGKPVVVRYDPADHTKVELVATGMPRGGPRTPSNIRLLEGFTGCLLVLLALARIARPRSPWQNGSSSMPLTP
jgi:Protein of unknown function (DUF3592)